MKTNIDFDKISQELQNRINFVIEKASENSEINIENCVEAATIAKLVSVYALELYTDELLEILYEFQSSQK